MTPSRALERGGSVLRRYPWLCLLPLLGDLLILALAEGGAPSPVSALPFRFDLPPTVGQVTGASPPSSPAPSRA